MLNELEQKIRKAIPELDKYLTNRFNTKKPIQLNHVLEYLISNGGISVNNKFFSNSTDYEMYQNYVVWNLKSNLLSDQSIELIKFVNELKND